MENSVRNITQAGTTVVATGSGTLVRIIVNTTANGAIQIYDDESAVETSLIGTLKASVAEQSFEYGVPFLRGLTIVTAAASDITVVHK